MKLKILIVSFIIGSLILWDLSAQVEFIEVTTLEEMVAARQEASEKDLPLFVDVYATWCGPCKMMDREVYTDPAVAMYMNTNLVSVKMDGEIEYGARFASENGLQGYPSMFLFDPGGEHMSTLVGFLGAEELVEKLKGTVDNYQISGQMSRDYKSGTLDHEKYPDYLSSMRAMGKEEEAEAIVLKYIDDMEPSERISDTDIRIIAPYLTMDHELWPMVAGDIERMKAVLGDDYMLVIERAFNKTLMKGIDAKDITIIKLLSDKIGSYVEGTEAGGVSLEHLPYLQYYYYSGLNRELIAYIDTTYETSYKDDHNWLFEVASRVIDMDQQYVTPEIQNKGVEWFRTCIDLEEKFDYYFYEGMCLYFTQKIPESKVAFTRAGELAGDPDEQQLIQQVMQFINNAE